LKAEEDAELEALLGAATPAADVKKEEKKEAAAAGGDNAAKNKKKKEKAKAAAAKKAAEEVANAPKELTEEERKAAAAAAIAARTAGKSNKDGQSKTNDLASHLKAEKDKRGKKAKNHGNEATHHWLWPQDLFKRPSEIKYVPL